ncbi:MAG: thiol:disulfide interchange protein DsbG [Gammaproteobacteria bacterium]|nr:thiol:disulfide interchange protein DsbG [Gammaproteobacteria bacterium]
MKNMLKLTLLAGLVSLSFSAQAKLNLDSPAAKLVTKLTYNQVTITNEFKAANGWQGFVVQTKKQNSQAILFVDPANKYLFAGALIAADGTNLTQQYTDEYINKAIAKNAGQAIAKTHWISEGSDSAPHKIYVLIDPNCIYCHMSFQSLAPFIAGNQLQVRWVSVGIIKSTSLGKAAHLLSIQSPKDQIAALKQDENDFNSSQEEGGITALDESDPAYKMAFNQVVENNTFFTQNQFIGTPVIIYTKADGTPSIYAGLAQGKDLEAIVNAAGSSW